MNGDISGSKEFQFSSIISNCGLYDHVLAERLGTPMKDLVCQTSPCPVGKKRRRHQAIVAGAPSKEAAQDFHVQYTSAILVQALVTTQYCMHDMTHIGHVQASAQVKHSSQLLTKGHLKTSWVVEAP